MNEIARKYDEESLFEVHGYYEELMHPVTGKVYGIRLVKEPDRPLGSDGRIFFDITEPIWLKKGHRRVIVNASKDKPLAVCAMLQAVCGILKSNRKAEQEGTFYPQNPDKVTAPIRRKA